MLSNHRKGKGSQKEGLKHESWGAQALSTLKENLNKSFGEYNGSHGKGFPWKGQSLSGSWIGWGISRIVWVRRDGENGRRESIKKRNCVLGSLALGEPEEDRLQGTSIGRVIQQF